MVAPPSAESGELKRQRDRARRKERAHLIKILVFNHYSDGDIKCACCGERRIEFLTLEHLNNDGAEHRRQIGSSRGGGDRVYRDLVKQGLPPGYAVKCWNCNCAKGAYGYCPHERESEMMYLQISAQEFMNRIQNRKVLHSYSLETGVVDTLLVEYESGIVHLTTIAHNTDSSQIVMQSYWASNKYTRLSKKTLSSVNPISIEPEKERNSLEQNESN